MKILLAYQSGLPHRKDPYISILPTGLCYLHASLKEAGYNSLLANFSAWTASQVKRELLTFKPDIVGISQWTHNRQASVELAEICRSLLPECTIIMGGAHATFCYEDVLSKESPVDIVVLGEGEKTLLELVDAIRSGSGLENISGIAFRHNGIIRTTRPRTNISELDSLPIPSQYFESSISLDLELQAEFIVTTRGCPSTCYFCSSPDFWGKKVRFRSPQAIVDEILYIRKKYGLIYFSIRDDTFTADRKRVLDFCKILQSENVNILWNCQSRVTAIDEELIIEMKRAGCECIQLGVESGSLRILQQLGKKITPPEINSACSIIRKIGINLSIYLISEVPGETADDIQQTVELLQNIHPDDGYISPLAYFPGTKLYKDAVAAGLATPTLFTDNREDALYVSAKRSRSSSRLLKELAKNQQSDPKRFTMQKELLGECYTTNVIAGEWYRQSGDYNNAEKEFKRITTVMPDNPWGWFLLGDLYSELGRINNAKECYRRVLSIVPKHKPSKVGVSI